MCEILRENFDERFPEIKDVIERSSFVAIDTEFTGLSTNDSSCPSLFDEAKTRYKKLKKSISQFVICQFGLCAFVEIPDQPNRYQAYAFNFYLFQPSFGPVDCRFLCQASSLHFLSKHNFDFNKFIHHGVPYLNKDQEEEIRKQHKEQSLYSGTQSLELRGLDDQISSSISRTESWLEHAHEGDKITLDSENYTGQYLLFTELKNQLNPELVKCEVTNNLKIVVTRQKSSSKKKIKEQQTKEEEKILLSVIGFSRIIKLLIKLKKPLVGHNLLTDLLLLYDKFIKPLPEKYADFKANLHKAFPFVYDTKHLAFKIRKHQKLNNNCTFLDNTNLEDLHAALSSDEAKFFVLYNPGIDLADISQKYGEEQRPHEAGYDAYLSGFVFLRMTHLFAAKLQKSQLFKPFPFSKFIKVLQPYENQVNIPRATIPFVNLSGNDPPSVRPQWFFVESNVTQPLSGHKVAKQFVRFGSVDVKIIDQCHAVVAVAHHRRVDNVLKLVKKNKSTTVRLYNSLYDSYLMRNLIWSGGVFTTLSLCIGAGLLIWRVLK
ncbi:poly(A)-specific ribonuclease PNLDC1-like [Actinia tenebrosa]|uniref:Poly(A)-specific ribonuclease PNLDC1-like n=1 Tax=Actinia tenebrosa TaxID=6105 RepID=A0A6P8HY10_ACTTE|nr:poly(A)-specific ribonuclease PNLDC1-like [Actinia tenebrosa]